MPDVADTAGGERSKWVARAKSTVEGYFDALEAAEFDRAVTYFTEDVRYSHPPYPDEPPGSARHELRGRKALRELFEYRGPRASANRIDILLATDEDLMFSGVVFDEAGTQVLSYVSTGRLEPSTGRLSEYTTYVSAPPVWATLESRSRLQTGGVRDTTSTENTERRSV